MFGPDHEPVDLALKAAIRDNLQYQPRKSSRGGRDGLGGASFVMVGADPTRSKDIYITRDATPAEGSELDIVAYARIYMPALIEEVRRLRSQLLGPAPED